MISSIWPKASVACMRPAIRSTRADRRLEISAPICLSGFQSIRGEADGVRKDRIQHQKFGDAVRLYVRGVALQ